LRAKAPEATNKDGKLFERTMNSDKLHPAIPTLERSESGSGVRQMRCEFSQLFRS
jgi:hypothetical protein